MVTWQQEWQAIANRIKGLERAAFFLFSSLPGVEGDLYDAGDSYIIPQATAVLDNLKAYQGSYTPNLPPLAGEALGRFLKQTEDMLRGQPPKGLAGVQGTITALTSFEAEFTYLVNDHDSLARRITDRAFIHLQRMILVDPEYGEKWRNAFTAGETDCEKLGAVHLLYHGIWAFKDHAPSRVVAGSVP